KQALAGRLSGREIPQTNTAATKGARREQGRARAGSAPLSLPELQGATILLVRPLQGNPACLPETPPPRADGASAGRGTLGPVFPAGREQNGRRALARAGFL